MIRHVHVNECDSTQDILKEQLSDSSLDNILVSCDHQLKGRGRGSNTWSVMPGTLCFSLSLRAHAEQSFTALEVSLLITKFFETKGKYLKLKWPNDIWNEDFKKCCGVLLQNSHNVMVSGIGLNLFSDSPEFGGVYDAPFESDKRIWAHDIADYIVKNRFERTEDLKREWDKRCFHLNTEVTITENGETFTGIFQGLGSHGEAVLITPDGEMHIYNGTLRPTTSVR